MARYVFSLPRLYVDVPLESGQTIALEKDQANYLQNVMRLGQSDPFLLFNGRDGEFRAHLAGGNRKKPDVAIGEQTRPQTPAADLWYVFAPLKAARLDYMVQKAVEMGATRLLPAMTHRTVASRVNLERMRANVVEAAEQCGILSIAEVAEDRPLAKVMADWPAGRALIYCDEDAEVADPVAALSSLPRNAPVGVLIGPEGGFDDEERAALLAMPSTLRLSLGPRILRADTAAVAALTLVQAAVGDFRG